MLIGLILLAPSLAVTARAATPAESFISDNIQKGLQILGNKGPQRASQFESFLGGA